MDRKGVLGWFLAILPQLLITIGLLVLLFVIFLPIINDKLSADTGEQSARSNFQALSSSVEEVIESEKEYQSTRKFISIPVDHGLVGFDSGKEWTEVLIPTSRIDITNFLSESILENRDNYFVYKPDRCGSSACVCIYESFPPLKEENKNDNIVSCKILEEDTRVFGYMGGTTNLPRGVSRPQTKLFADQSIQLEFLFIFSHPGIPEVPGFKASSDFYVSKIEKDGEKNIIISPYPEEFDDFKEEFVRCPPYSQEGCDDVPHNTVHYDQDKDQYYGCIYDGSRDYCVREEMAITQCVEGRTLDKKCRCGSQIAFSGEVCKDGEVYEIDCTLGNINTCEDYCVDSTDCSDSESVLCEADPCNLKEKVYNGEKGCKMVQKHGMVRRCIAS